MHDFIFNSTYSDMRKPRITEYLIVNDDTIVN